MILEGQSVNTILTTFSEVTATYETGSITQQLTKTIVEEGLIRPTELICREFEADEEWQAIARVAYPCLVALKRRSPDAEECRGREREDISMGYRDQARHAGSSGKRVRGREVGNLLKFSFARHPKLCNSVENRKHLGCDTRHVGCPACKYNRATRSIVSHIS